MTERPLRGLSTKNDGSGSTNGGIEAELRALAVIDESCIESFLGLRLEGVDAADLDAKTRSLVRLGALVAAAAAPATFQWAVEVALAAGASDQEVIGTLVAVAPIVGMAPVVSAAPDIAVALGYPIESALERITDPLPGHGR